jgi:hypothetical protein
LFATWFTVFDTDRKAKSFSTLDLRISFSTSPGVSPAIQSL